MWAELTKDCPEGVDSWSHWEHGPDNNPVSTDTVITAPYRTQWLGVPYYIAMPAITTVAGGRIFTAMGHIAHHKREEKWLNTVLARNGYNGEELWLRRLPDGYLVHRSAFVATDDVFYMIDSDGDGCLMLDPETGKELDTLHVPDLDGEWKWMALQDGVLFVLAGKKKDPPETTLVRSTYRAWSWGELSRGYYEKRVPWGFGETIVAYDLDQGKTLWRHTEDKPIDSRAMVIGGGRVFFYGPDSHTGCLDAKSGAVVWTNDDRKIIDLIEEPGSGLQSTPGFRTTCFCLYTPEALFYEAQTRMNIVAVSNKDGSLLWSRKKTTNNPNMLYAGGHLLVGIGPEGNTLVLDPLTGDTIEDLGFKKRSCVRLTATHDSFFCRGWPEGLTRYDRNAKKVLFNGAMRPSCNDGVIAANGMLYFGPWLCDCNLSLMGTTGMCSAGDFRVEDEDPVSERLEVAEAAVSAPRVLEITQEDWPTYHGNNDRGACSKAVVRTTPRRRWAFQPEVSLASSAPSAAGGLIFSCADDGKVRAFDAETGQLRWSFATAGPIKQPPTISKGRAYVGSGDGYVYALEAATGRQLWRFRAAPVERRIMLYGSLCSTWPVNSGVLVEDGVAYAAAGFIDYDGTYVCALDAITGEPKWRNNTSGHLDEELRKGVSPQGALTIAGNRLWMPGGNVISPAAYDIKTGECLTRSVGNGSPRTNRGEEIGVLGKEHLILGGRLQYSATKNYVNPGSFEIAKVEPGRRARMEPLGSGKIPPAWSSEIMVMVNGPNTVPACIDVAAIDEYVEKCRSMNRDSKLRSLGRLKKRWVANDLRGGDTVALAIASNAVLVAYEMPRPRSLASQWFVSALDPDTGKTIWKRELPSGALAGGLLVDRDGRVVVTLENGGMVCFG